MMQLHHLRRDSQIMRGKSKADEYEVSDVVGDFQGLDSDRPLCQGGRSCVLSCTIYCVRSCTNIYGKLINQKQII